MLNDANLSDYDLAPGNFNPLAVSAYHGFRIVVSATVFSASGDILNGCVLQTLPSLNMEIASTMMSGTQAVYIERGDI